MNNLAVGIPVLLFGVACQHDERQIGERGELLKSLKLKGLDDDGNIVLTVGNRAETVLREDAKSELGKIVTCVCKLILVILQLDVEACLPLTVDRARGVSIQDSDVFNDLLQRDHLVLVVLELGSI